MMHNPLQEPEHTIANNSHYYIQFQEYYGSTAQSSAFGPEHTIAHDSQHYTNEFPQSYGGNSAQSEARSMDDLEEVRRQAESARDAAFQRRMQELVGSVLGRPMEPDANDHGLQEESEEEDEAAPAGQPEAQTGMRSVANLPSGGEGRKAIREGPEDHEQQEVEGAAPFGQAGAQTGM